MFLKTHSILSYIIILLGIIHILFVFPIEQFNTDTLWFIGTGVAIIFAGFINIIATKSSEKFVRKICILANFSMMFLFLIALFTLQELQVFVGTILFGASLYLSSRKKIRLIARTDKREANAKAFADPRETYQC